MASDTDFDVIVVGGGHAGTEAAIAAARMGAKTLLLTQNLETLGQMSCNPAIGGIGKGHLTREIDALDGLMALAADHCGIQFRRLNASKGPAVRATRAQIDRSLYRSFVRQALENTEGLTLFQQSVDDLIVEDGRVQGVVTAMGFRFRARSVVLTVGTFLGGMMHVGAIQMPGGRAGDPPANRLAARLRELARRTGRLKTGTPPRIDGRSIDYDRLSAQPGDVPVPRFSMLSSEADLPPQVACHIARTNARTHDVIRADLHLSPMYSGAIEGVGPRYCPSIEDKVVRFADRDSHQIFLEPEGLQTREVYPNGISTSLPFETQLRLVRTIEGLEHARITRPGYAIEYDFFDPRDLASSLETRDLPGLFMAGQINGTTGYEEAAAQGLMAGVNAVLAARAEPPLVLGRDQAYIGVLIDDLVTLGTTEPYRMFTSRAEFRLLLREDNADLRLTELGHQFGLVRERRYVAFCRRRDAISQEQARLASLVVRPEMLDPQRCERLLGQPLAREQRASELLKRPDMTHACLMALMNEEPSALAPDVVEQIEIQARYDGYIQRQQREIARLSNYAECKIPADLDFAAVTGLSAEVCQKLTLHRPENIAQAGRISGVTPAAVSVLLVHLRRLGGASAGVQVPLDEPQRIAH